MTVSARTLDCIRDSLLLFNFCWQTAGISDGLKLARFNDVHCPSRLHELEEGFFGTSSPKCSMKAVFRIFSFRMWRRQASQRIFLAFDIRLDGLNCSQNRISHPKRTSATNDC